MISAASEVSICGNDAFALAKYLRVQAVSRYTNSENKYIFHVIKWPTWLERNLANTDLAEFSISDAKSIEIFISPLYLT